MIFSPQQNLSLKYVYRKINNWMILNGLKLNEEKNRAASTHLLYI